MYVYFSKYQTKHNITDIREKFCITLEFSGRNWSVLESFKRHLCLYK